MSRNICSTSCPDCGWSFAPDRSEGAGLLTEDQYLAEIGRPDSPYRENAGHGWGGRGRGLGDEVRFLRIDCVGCARLFAGWYRREGGDWRLFDSSYFFAFDDEPDERDIAGAHAPTRLSDSELKALIARSGRSREATVYAELLVARRVVEAARKLAGDHQCVRGAEALDKRPCEWCAAQDALAAYDEAVR